MHLSISFLRAIADPDVAYTRTERAHQATIELPCTNHNTVRFCFIRSMAAGTNRFLRTGREAKKQAKAAADKLFMTSLPKHSRIHGKFSCGWANATVVGVNQEDETVDCLRSDG